MEYGKIKKLIKRLTFYLEFVLAMFLAASVIVGMVDLGRYLVEIYTTNPYDTYEIFQKFLGHVLLLVVGVELVVMLVYHSPSSVIEVLLYAVARKVLIGNQGMLDFFIGIIAIAAIFGIRKFLFIENLSGNVNGGEIVSAATPTRAANELLKINIPEELGNTIGGVLCNLSQKAQGTLYEGAEYCVNNVEIRIVKMQEGVIEKVYIEAKNK